jgi:hypothetical protein
VPSSAKPERKRLTISNFGGRQRIRIMIGLTPVVAMLVACGSPSHTTSAPPTHGPATTSSSTSSTFTTTSSTTTAPPTTTASSSVTTDKSWSVISPNVASNADPPTGISCASNHFCVLVDSDGNAYIFDGSDWSSGAQVSDNFYDVSCPVANYCVAVGAGGAYVYSGNSWDGPVAKPGEGVLDSISCTAPSFCMAVDEDGGAAVFNGSVFSDFVQADGPNNDNSQAGFESVSCANPTMCIGVGSNGEALTYQNGTWGSPVEVAPETGYTAGAGSAFQASQSVSCDSPTFCAAVDEFSNGYTFNGSQWNKQTRVSTWQLDTISCPSSTWCAAGGGNGNRLSTSFSGVAMTFDNGAWSPSYIIDQSGQIDGISCPSQNSCFGFDPNGEVLELQ